MKLQSLWTFLSLLNIFSDYAEVVKHSKWFRIILNKVTKLVDLPEFSKYFSDFPQVVKHFLRLRIVVNKVRKLVDLPESPNGSK